LRTDADRQRNTGSSGAHGEIDALGALYDAHARQVYAYVRSLGAKDSLAEDILQEVFLRLVRQRVKPARISNMRAYLVAAARREFFRWRTRILRRDEIALDSVAGIFEPASGRGLSTDEAAAKDALALLPAAQREVVVMKVYGGFTFEEIAEAMETSVSTAASRYRYALEKLKELLGER